MQYKALIFDLDGTAIETKSDALPTQRTIEAVKIAEKLIYVSVATARQLYNSKNIIDKLGIVNPCIFAGGAQIKNPLTNEIIWHKQMSVQQVERILFLCKKLPYKTIFSEDKKWYTPKDRGARVAQPEEIIYLQETEKEKTANIIKELEKIPDLAVHPTGSWKKGCWDVHITHKEASKKHALLHLLEYFHVKKEEVMVVGDTGNDMPLFESGGFKVAMGNATEELKQKADFITKSVQEDGLAFAIEKFITSNPTPSETG
jgi:Cof subfamily protein (haloacid dehalogenase superfamily)